MLYDARARRVVVAPGIAQPSACATWPTVWTVSPSGAPSTRPGANTAVHPPPRAAANRWRIPGAGRPDPVSEISLTQADPVGGIVPVPAATRDAATARAD